MRNAVLAAASLAALSAVSAQVVPTAPWASVVDRTGSPCEIQWNLDPTGTWTNMSIFLTTGSNQDFVTLQTVVTNLDGTTGDGKFSWTCPAVTPNAAIYFYTFSNNGAPVSTWTTRFTLADASGNVVDPPESTQPGGQAIPWGTGRLLNGNGGGAGGSSSRSSSSASSFASQPSSSKQGLSSTASSAPSSSSAVPSSPPPADDTADTTVITVTPPSSSTGRTTLQSSASASGINNQANSNSTGAASPAAHGSIAGVGLVLAVLSGLVLA